MRFDEYLRERGVLREADVTAIAEAQVRTNVWFGTLAYLLGYLDFDGIGRILEAQQQAPALFGELAVEMGLMTAEQMEEVADLQHRKHVKFGEVAVALRYLSRDQLRQYLGQYARAAGVVIEE